MTTSVGGGDGGSSGSYQYTHDETATTHLYHSSSTRSSNYNNQNLNSRVYLESTSTFQSSIPIFHNNNYSSWDISNDVLTNNGTPFSRQVLELLHHYPLQRLLIRVGDAASSSGSSISLGAVDTQQQYHQEERARGPSGTSVLATFASSQNNNDNNNLIQHYQDEYASLLRYLLDNTLFPPCGAPLDSLRVRKHGHSIIVHSPEQQPNDNDTATQYINVESFLAADAATFCNPGIKSFILSSNDIHTGNKSGGGGWGGATNNGACHSSDITRGLFNSFFAPSSSSTSSNDDDDDDATLSELLLGLSLDATPWEVNGDQHQANNKRNSVWIDLQVSPSCFSSSIADGEECTVTVTRGTSYRVAVPYSMDDEKQFNLSLGDVFLGHNTMEEQSPKVGRKAWHPCPLSDSSRILMYLPKGYDAKFVNGVNTVYGGGVQQEERIEFDVLALTEGYIDLAAPWAQLYAKEKTQPGTSQQQQSLYGISRTVHRPLGISSSGTLVSVLRYGQLDLLSSEQQSNMVKVQSLDILPGTLIKPRMQTLHMIYYQGGGAGGERFVPPIESASQFCECKNETDSSGDTSSDQCGLICTKQTSLSELQDHRIILHSDGTIHLERTMLLQPDSSLWMMVDFDEAYLPFQKFPADANRGVDIFPATATFSPVQPASHPQPVTLYSPSLLILPPVPDMSMPFNVISLSCTLWAFVLGSLLNILVRRATESVKRELTGEKEKRPIDKIKDKVRKVKVKLLSKIKRKKDTEKVKKVVEKPE